MSLLTEVGTYIYTGLGLTPGTDFFLHNLPESAQEGVVLQELSITENFIGFNLSRISIFLFYPSWATQENYLALTTELLYKKYGTTDGGWCIQGDIQTTNFGLDTNNRYVTAVNASIRHT
jgi:hypothetical protein